MQFTRAGQLKIINVVRDSPLGESEYRRISGMGATYLARENAPQQDEYAVLAILEIDGAPHKLCRRFSDLKGTGPT